MKTNLSGTYRYNGPLNIFYEYNLTYNLSVKKSFFLGRIHIEVKRGRDSVVWSSRHTYPSEADFRADWTYVPSPARNERGQFAKRAL